MKHYVKNNKETLRMLKWKDLQDVLLSEKKSKCKTVYIVACHLYKIKGLTNNFICIYTLH